MADEEEEENKSLYDASVGPAAVVIDWRRSVLPNVLKRPELWAMWLVNCAVTIAVHRKLLVIDPSSVPKSALGVLTSLMTFFLVFYTNNCFGRYFALYEKVRDMMGCLLEFVSDLRLRIDSRDTQRRAMYYLLAGTFGFFIEANEGDLGPDQIAQLGSRGLLSDEEVAYLQEKYPARNKSFVMLQWAMEVATWGLRKQVNFAGSNDRYIQQFQNKVYGLRRVHQDILDTLKLPLPFQYFHIMNLMLIFVLTLIAIVGGTTGNYVGIVVFFMCAMAFLSIREVSMAMSDPFGEDDVDFPVALWMQEALLNCLHLVEYDYKVGVASNFINVAPLKQAPKN